MYLTSVMYLTFVRSLKFNLNSELTQVMHPDKLTRKRRLIDGIARTVEEEWEDGYKAERHLARHAHW